MKNKTANKQRDSDTHTQQKFRKGAYAIRHFFFFFLLMSFVVTCNVLVLLSSMELDIRLLRKNAPLAFLNVVFLSLLFWGIDGVRRKLRVERPVRQIETAMEQIIQGDFSIRLAPVYGTDSMNEFDAIINGLNQMAEELSGVETLRTDFISNVSHELKTPLAIIQNYGTMLQQPGLPEGKRMEYAKALTEASRRLANLITNILKLNKLENQQIFPESRAYNLGEQLCECMLSFEEIWEKKNLQIETEIDEEIIVEADEELLSLVWNNLLSNAMKFTEEQGTVRVSLKKEGNDAVVTVTDTGCGISPETGKHIFEKFYQGDTSHATQGNGLGLALVKRVVDITGGDISVESVLGEGSTFTVRLRRRTAAEEDVK